MKNIAQIKKAAAAFLYVYLVDDTDGYTPETGVTGAGFTISKNGGAFAAPQDGGWTELGNGWYKAALDTTDTNTLGPLALNVAATGCRNFTDVVEIVTDTLEDVNGLVKRILGLSLENYYLDNMTYSDGKLSSARIRLYDSAANVGTPNGVVGTYTITATYAGTELASYKVVKI